jgi:hypothetical protein
MAAWREGAGKNCSSWRQLVQISNQQNHKIGHCCKKSCCLRRIDLASMERDRARARTRERARERDPVGAPVSRSGEGLRIEEKRGGGGEGERPRPPRQREREGEREGERARGRGREGERFTGVLALCRFEGVLTPAERGGAEAVESLRAVANWAAASEGWCAGSRRPRIDSLPPFSVSPLCHSQSNLSPRSLSLSVSLLSL